MTAAPSPKQQKLESWKEIAAYLNRDVRTARRWEKERGLPVRRPPGARPVVYALVAEIDEWLNNDANRHSSAQPAAEPVAVSVPKLSRLVWAIVAVASVTAIALALLLVFREGPASPRLSVPAEITRDGWTKRSLLRQGAALFYQTKDPRGGMSEDIRRIGDSGDQFLAALPPGPGVGLLDVSTDGSRILFSRHVAGDCNSELWEIPLATAQPHRVGRACATAAAWSPNGATLAYAAGRDLYLAKPDGDAPQKLLDLPYDAATDLRWSPDGLRIRLVLRGLGGEPERLRLWDVQILRRTVTPLLPGWSRDDTDDEWSGQWTTDGRYFVFAARHNGANGVWAIREASSLLGRWLARPVFLTGMPKTSGYVTVGPRDNKIFAIVGLPQRGELLRLDPKTQQFALDPRWAWLSGGQVAFSPDGGRVAYLTYPEHRLSIAGIDGKNQHLLTQSAWRGSLAQWSPDGQRLAFMSWKQGAQGPTRIRIVSPDGQDPVEPVHLPGWQGGLYWTSDSEIVFGDNGPTFPIPATCLLHVFDLQTGKVADLPHTNGLWTARPCPTGRYIAAQTNDKSSLILYNRLTASRTELFHSPEGHLGDNPTWSRDGAYIYMDVPYARDPAVYRIRIEDRKVERIASLAGIQRVVEGIGLWMGLAPDDSLLILRQVEGSEIDSWDWVEP